MTLNAILPMLSVILGAVITYAVNVRLRRSSYIDDLFNEAIAAVAAAEFSTDYLATIEQPEHMSNADFQHLRSWIPMEANKNYVKKQVAANEALARVVPYSPSITSVMPFKPDASNRGTYVNVIALLRKGPTFKKSNANSGSWSRRLAIRGHPGRVDDQ